MIERAGRGRLTVGSRHLLGPRLAQRAGPDGLVKGQYRKFNIRSEDLTPGDDYAMMREMLTRLFSRLLREAGPRDLRRLLADDVPDFLQVRVLRIVGEADDVALSGSFAEGDGDA